MNSFLKPIAGAVAALLVATTGTAVIAQSMSSAMAPAPSAKIAQIDVTCDTMVQQQKLIKPVHVVYASSTWKVASDADAMAAEQTKGHVIVADVWKQNGKYVWVHAHRFTESGAQRATQLCFGLAGHLLRVKQATTIPALDEAGAVRAYFNSDGTLVAKFGAFEANDPTISKAVKALPYYSVLP